MGRIFETRKHKIFARMDKMAKAFTKIGKEIAMAAAEGGMDPNNNSRLRAAIQNAKGVNMPKEKVEAAIKRSQAKDLKGLQEMTYEGYGPHGVAMMVDCATDNTTRTVSNLRVHFDRNGGTLGNKGTVEFIFTRKGVFHIPKANINLEEMELELIDFGAEEIEDNGEEIIIYTLYQDYGTMQKGLESKNIVAKSSELQRIPTTTKALSEEQEEEVMKLIGVLEDDDDVQSVFHNLA